MTPEQEDRWGTAAGTAPGRITKAVVAALSCSGPPLALADGFAIDHVGAGIGAYRADSDPETGASSPDELYYLLDVAASFGHEVSPRYTWDARADYSARFYDSRETRNDSDLRLRGGVTRTLGMGSLSLALRGRREYVGQGDHRHDYGASLDWAGEAGDSDEFSVGTHVRRRQYPRGDLRDRSRTIADGHIEWTHAFLDGRAAATLGAHGGYQFATRRDDGTSWFGGVSAGIDYDFDPRLALHLAGLWERNRFNTEHVHFHPDELDERAVLRRRDRLRELSATLTWEFSPGWSLEPNIVHVRDDSNLDDFHYRSTDYWLMLRKSF